MSIGNGIGIKREHRNHVGRCCREGKKALNRRREFHHRRIVVCGGAGKRYRRARWWLVEGVENSMAGAGVREPEPRTRAYGGMFSSAPEAYTAPAGSMARLAKKLGRQAAPFRVRYFAKNWGGVVYGIGGKVGAGGRQGRREGARKQ